MLKTTQSNRDLWYRVLFVEDDPDLVPELAKLCKTALVACQVDFAETKREADEYLARKHYHFVSVDQNIPDLAGEVVSAQYGLNFCESLVATRPLTDRAIYTAYGEPQYGNRVGRLDGTRYIEKRTLEIQANSMDTGEYVVWIGQRLQEEYHLWALDRAKRFVPGSLGEAATSVADAWREAGAYVDSNGDAGWRAVAARIDILWERALWLSWAQASALGVAAGRGGHALDIEDLHVWPRDYVAAERALESLWPQLAEYGMLEPWRKYIGVGNADTGSGTGRLFLDAARELRQWRNLRSHDRVAYTTSAQLEAIKPAVVRLLDALAFWGEAPLITSLRYHPSDRARVQFVRMMGSPPWPIADLQVPSTFRLPPNAMQHVFVPWESAGRLQFIDLYPFVFMETGAIGRLEPHVLAPSSGPNLACRSLVSGFELVGGHNWRPGEDTLRALSSVRSRSW